MTEPEITLSGALRDDSPKLFSIAPLNWEKHYTEDREAWTVQSVFGTYEVSRNNWNDDQEWTDWQWKFCFDEYYDEGEYRCSGPDEGKAAAEAHYISRISPALIPV